MMPTDHTSPLPDPPHPSRARVHRFDPVKAEAWLVEHRDRTESADLVKLVDQLLEHHRSLRNEAPGNSRTSPFSPHESCDPDAAP